MKTARNIILFFRLQWREVRAMSISYNRRAYNRNDSCTSFFLEKKGAIECLISVLYLCIHYSLYVCICQLFFLTHNSSRYIIDIGITVIVLENCVYLNHVVKFE